MLILALDTTSEMGGVGIFRGAECLSLVSNEEPANRYSVSLFEMAERALAGAHLELCEIELYAVANGPGSFTGIRVGLAAARAWGKAFGRPVRGVSILEALVHKACLCVSPEPPPSRGGESAGEGEGPLQRHDPDWYFPILDARRGEFYLGSFRRKSSVPSISALPAYEPADGGWVLKPDSLQAFLKDRLTGSPSATCLVRAHDQVAARLRTVLPSSLNWQAVEGLLVNSLAGIAEREALSGRSAQGANLEAYYIRRPDAEVTWKGD